MLASCRGPANAPGANGATVGAFVLSSAHKNSETGSLYVASRSGIAIYAGKSLEYSRTITNGISVAEAIDFNSRAQLFVANEGSSSVTVYSSGGSSPIRTLTNKFMKDPHGEAISPNDDLYVLSRSFINLFAKGRQDRSKQIKFSSLGIAIDSSGNAYIPTASGVIDVLAPGATKPTKTIGEGLKGVIRLAIDTAGNLYVGQATSSHCGSIAEYDTATGQLENTITSGVCDPVGFAFDSRDDLYVSNYANGFTHDQSVTMYSLGSNTPTETITDGVSGPVALAIDPSNDLYVANLGLPGSVTVYPLGATSPSRVLTKGIDAPLDLRWLP
jgi:hypothetical protein